MPHLMLDCYGTSEKILNSLGSTNEILVDLCDDMALKPVMPPFLLPYYYAKDVEDDGISAFVLLNGGHATFHSFPKRRCYFVDIFTERYFDSKRAVKFFAEHAPHTEHSVIHLNRRFKEEDLTQAAIANKFGAHIVCRFKSGSAVTLDDIFTILDYLPGKVGMQPICRPLVLKDNRTDPKYISGIVLIAQSHIAFHYSLEENIVYFDLFSCAAFDFNAVVQKLKEEFKTDFDFQIAPRGLKHNDKRVSQRERIDRESRWMNASK